MSAARLHPHHSLPAPVVHAGFAASQSKSHVLAGVQDAYWSDDEAEDTECPLCSEEMDISDLNFKPCICGYQICRFCWHHIKENLNKRCPACRRVYTDEAVEFKPIPTQDHKRLTQHKKQRERERKELDILGRRHLANVRVVQRNVVYIVGIGPRFAKEELIPTLRSNEYFGQYGKITKILLVKRTLTGGGNAVVGLYITYHRKEDAARCISSVDGTASPSGGREILRASYGTTKYCLTFLRGVSCSDHSCMNLHEWGDEKDCFTKEDLTTLKHTMKTTETRSRNAGISAKKGEDTDATLPRTAAWGQKAQGVPASNAVSNVGVAVRQPRRGAGTRQQRSSGTAHHETRAMNTRASTQDPKPSTMTKPSLQTSSPTPSYSVQQQVSSATSPKKLRTKKELTQPALSQSPAPSSLADSDAEPGIPASMPQSPAERCLPTESMQPPLAAPLVPPGLSAALPAPSAPPGLPCPSRPPRVETASPQTPLLASQSSYQMSNAARALLDDVKARWEAALPATIGSSPFPDFDRTLQTLSGGENGGFSFNLDPKLAKNEEDNSSLPDFAVEANLPFHGSYTDAFSPLRGPSESSPALTAPPGLPYRHHPNRLIYEPLAARISAVAGLEREISSGLGYMGSFNPFGDGTEEHTLMSESTLRRPHNTALDDDPSQKVSRFGFARGRQGSTATASPPHVLSPLSTSNDIQPHSSELFAQLQWPKHTQQNHSQIEKGSTSSSPVLHQAAPSAFALQPTAFQSFTSSVTEAQLRDFIQASKDRVFHASGVEGHPLSNVMSHSAQFNDPAIVSTPFISPVPDLLYSHLSYGPPPGLSFPHGTTQNISVNVHPTSGTESTSAHVSTRYSPVPSLVLSSSDFPALAASPIESSMGEASPSTKSADIKSQEQAERKASKKAVAAEKAAERQKLAQERAAVKAAERAKIAREKMIEKEKIMIPQELSNSAKELQGQALKVANSERGRSSHVEQSPPVEKEKDRGNHLKTVIAKSRDLKHLNQTVKPSKLALLAKTSSPLADPAPQVPILSKKPKKNKPITKTIKITKEDVSLHDETSTIPSTVEGALFPTDSSSTDSRSHSLDRNTPTPIEDLLEEIDIFNPGMDLLNHPFFDTHRLNPTATMPLEYGPLVHALSALSVGGGSFANNMPSGSIDNAVSSFQQLLETLTQTISDLLRLLPRTTWDDSSSFDGVLRDMLKGDDFLDDAGDEGRGKEDEVAALTLALERRARWMEVQLSKLEELHRDINTAAVRAVLSFNDNGWDRHTFLPRVGNSLRRFDSIGLIEEDGVVRSMSSAELGEKLAVAKEAAVFAEAEVREAMERIQLIRPAGTSI